MKRFDVDKWGAFASGLCAVHCLLVGVAFGLLPVLGLEFMASHEAEIGFFSAAILFGFWAIASGRRKHGSWLPAKVFAAGLALVAVSHFVIGHPDGHGHGLHSAVGLQLPESFGAVGTAMAVAGGLTLVAFHFVNHRLANKATCGCPVCHIEDGVRPVVHERR
ncbi:MAG: MerC domain-containing protein [Armatimonadetes bacterium]|nr:MerC domain-containing protein [Armatimonadota bacterium]